ncbi:extracellular solute-binding protein [Paenibacillus koleovorans]|uniref:extracellular solute-binding protein n=1 Tax=Paenibacillus koleovorans TaxID=121608 RepID=UPI000FDB815B|nr:extracellular solute-binding protein [Paenibacillus koleovorans]
MGKSKKWVPVLLGTVCAAVVVAGCSDNNSESQSSGSPSPSSSAAKKPTPIKVTLTTGNLGRVVASPNINEDKYLKKLEELSNTDLTLSLLPHENYQQAMSLLLAGGDLPDLLQTKGINTPEISPAIDAGVLLPLNELLDKYGPNLKKNVPAESWKSGRVSKDGKIYGIPGENPVTNGTVVYMRKDWLDKLGLKVPKTVEEYVNVLKAFRDNDPNGNGKKDEIPFSGRAKFSHTGHFFGAYDVPIDGWRMVSGKLTPNFVRPEMKEALKVYKMLYDEKLLDNEFITQPGNVWDNKIVTGQVGMWAHAATYPDTWLTRLKQNVPNAEIILVPAPVGPSGKPGGIFAAGSSVSDFVWTIPKNAKNPEEIIKFLDWFYSPEVPKDFFLYGLEGEDYTKENGKVNYKYPTEKAKFDDESMHQEWLHFTGPKLHLTDEAFVKGRSMGDLIFQGVSVAKKEGILNDGLDIDILPTVKARPELASDGIWLEFASKVITGKEPIDKFDEFVADWRKRGGDQWIEEATAWYNKTNKK